MIDAQRVEAVIFGSTAVDPVSGVCPNRIEARPINWASRKVYIAVVYRSSSLDELIGQPLMDVGQHGFPLGFVEDFVQQARVGLERFVR